MEGSYGVNYGNRQVGKVSVQRQGLYYKFRCRCQLAGDTVCRLRVICGDRQENLGIVVPIEGGFGLDTKLPAKRIGNGTPEFVLVPKYEKTAETCVPVYPEEPFAYISRLKDAYLVRRNEETRIILR